MRKLNLVILLSLCMMSSIIANSIKGTVIDEKGIPLAEVSIKVIGKEKIVQTDVNGFFEIEAISGDVLLVSFFGFENQTIKVGKSNRISIRLVPELHDLEEIVSTYYETQKLIPVNNARKQFGIKKPIYIKENTESYASVEENGFQNPLQKPLSTFSIDVDAASYSNIRRFLNNGQLPPKDAVRIEEMINYFDYDYKQPKGNNPFSVNYELSTCPWITNNQLLHIGLQGKDLDIEKAPASNLVFLIDVSGSMGSPNKLPLLKKAYTLLVNQLRATDKVAIVVYAGSSGVVLPSTTGDNKKEILKAIHNLRSGGGTAGAQGLELAYDIAEDSFIKGGNNRIILATDGDFNVGQSSDEELESLIVSKREKGIFISVTGFGMGNYKDRKMEIIADKGNGNYSYIDTMLEAKKVFINEFGGTLFTIAKDVKIQIEFNPEIVKRYRLIGYENRLLDEEDFQNDQKDAGELGAGHTVTAMYEIVPTNTNIKYDTDLKYQTKKIKKSNPYNSELGTVKFRYKKVNSSASKLIEIPISNSILKFENTSNNFQFSSAIAGFGMVLKKSDYKNNFTFSQVLKLAKKSKGEDKNGYRSEMIQLVEMASILY